MADGDIQWGDAIGGVIKTLALGAATVAAVAFLPQGLQLASDGLESLAGNATNGMAVSTSNTLGEAAQWLSSYYVEAINWAGQYLGSTVNPNAIISAAGATVPSGQTAAETVFTNWDTFSVFADNSAQKAGAAISGLWTVAKTSPLTIGAPVAGIGYLAYQLGKSTDEKSRPTLGPYTAAYNARNAARLRMATTRTA